MITKRSSLSLSSAIADQQPGLVLVESDDNPEDSQVKVTTNAELVDDEDLEVFKPTADWQTILPGQGIPAGLHVRMNLETGQKEAKLMDGDDGMKYQSNKDSKQKFITVDKNVISKQHLKEALKDFRDKFHNESPDGENSEHLQSQLDTGEFVFTLVIKNSNLYLAEKYVWLFVHEHNLSVPRRKWF